MRATFAIRFYLKSNQVKKNGQCTIMARLSINKEKTEFSTRIDIEPRYWDDEKKIAKGPRGNDVNHFLQVLRHRVQDSFWELYERGHDPDAHTLKKLVLGLIQLDQTLIKYLDDHNRDLKKCVGKTMTQDTYDRYLQTRHYLLNFLWQEFKVKDIHLRQVNLLFVKKYHVFLQTDCNLKEKTVYGYNSHLRKLVLMAFRSGIIKVNPYGEYKLKKPKSNVQPLMEDELRRIMFKTFDLQRL